VRFPKPQNSRSILCRGKTCTNSRTSSYLVYEVIDPAQNDCMVKDLSSSAKRSGVEGSAFVFLPLCRNQIVPDQ
jgi:hypothetical protein